MPTKIEDAKCGDRNRLAKWMEAVLHEELPAATDFEEALRNGQFHPETNDVYNKKNMPRVIYCLHALSRHLFRLGKAPLMSDLYGKVHFTDAQIDAMSKELKKYGIQMPAFQKIGGLLANEMPVDKAALHAAIIAINEALDHEDMEKFLNALENPSACLTGVLNKHVERYHSEMRSAKQAKIEVFQNKSLSDSFTADVYDELLTQAEIQGHLTSVNVQQAVKSKNEEVLFIALQAPVLDLKAIREKCTSLYMKELEDRFETEAVNNNMDSLECRLLLQRAITDGNNMALEHAKSVEAVWQVNKALSQGGPIDTLRALQNPALELYEVLPEAAPLYHEEMKTEKLETGCDLGLLEIRRCIHFLSQVAAVTHAVDSRNPELMWSALRKFEDMLEIEESLKEQYWKAFNMCRQKKRSEKGQWPMLTFFDIHDCVSDVNKQVDQQNQMVAAMHKLNKAVDKNSQQEEIKSHKNEDAPELWLQDVEHTLESAKKEALEANKACISLVKLHQALKSHDQNVLKEALQIGPMGDAVPLYPELSADYLRMLLECHKQKASPVTEVTPDESDSQRQLLNMITKIQSWWRGVLARRYVSQLRLQRAKQNGADTQNVLDFYRKHVKQIIRIQSLWRGRKTRKVFMSLVHQPNPPLSVVRQFVPILTPSPEDYETETKIQDVQAHSKNLSDVAGHHSNSSQELSSANTGTASVSSASSSTFGKGLKSLTKEGRNLLEGYQNLFYLLQTRPQYLSKLLFCLPHSRSMHFLQNVIFTLYNFGSNQRDEYLLLKLLRSALEEEIRQVKTVLILSKFTKPIEVLKVYPQVLKIAINFSREHSGKNALRAILGPLVQKVLNDKTLSIETNPVDIYKSWINHMEMSTGQPCELPRVVSQEEALKHEEVRKRLKRGIASLKAQTIAFLDHICESRDQLPYSLLFTARTLHDTLAKRFPGFPEKDLLKVIGNVVYYHFINAAIVAPDAYDIITLPADKTLTAEERSNLASIAKILQYAASKKGFGEESSHLTVLNPFIIECHEKFKKFLTYCCQVVELEDHFGMHAYSEATMIVKPTILIPLQEIWETHQLLLQYEDELAPNVNDPLHQLLEDLGPLTMVRKLLGGSSGDGFIPKGDLLLTLSNSKLGETPSYLSEEPDQSQLFMIKELLVSVLPFLPGNSLIAALDTPELLSQEEQFAKHQQQLHKDQGAASANSLRLSKMRLRLWLSQLERQGLVTAKDDYQSLLSAIARDICTRGQYCQAKMKELQTLKATISSLDQKTKFYQNQVEFYNMYIQTCLKNLDSGKRRVHQLRVSSKHPGRAKSHKSLRYSAAQLHSKGILRQMRGLTPAQYKSVQFEISPTSTVGVFEVKGCFMGVEVERVDIDIQQLLQFQYEGKTIMDMFGKAQINVNLLLFLLNKKFYVKS
ncbi:hypothetical protein B566_EDAN007965 [Ephemera danica]|nr:hypothetical protein B566_EDAN007965 [Ephemera danica]